MSFDRIRSVGESPAIFSCLVVCFYILLILPMAASRDFDLSAFVLAGDIYVDHEKLATPLRPVIHSYGYDGQFFYRLARHPLSVQPEVEGVTLDAPAKRMQRILYPVLARLISLGRAAWVPASLILINLAGLGAIAAIAAWLTRRFRLAWWFSYVVAAWPGFLVALTHDTAEIVTAAFLLAALACYKSDALVVYAAAAAAATLSRETAIPILLGPLILEIWAAVASPTSSRLVRAGLCGLAFVPFAIWHEVVGALWTETGQPLVGNPDLGWPLVGVAKLLLAQILGGQDGESGMTATFGHRAFVFLTAIGLIGFCAAVVIRLRRAFGPAPTTAVAIGWCLDLFLMSLLTATGPWVGPQAYLRAFTECWIVGCLLLSLSPEAPVANNAARLLATFAAADIIFLVWKLCFGVLPT